MLVIKIYSIITYDRKSVDFKVVTSKEKTGIHIISC